MPVEEQVRLILSRISGRNKDLIMPEMDLDTDLDIDAYSKVDVLADMEEAFIMEISDEQIDNAKTVQDLYDIVNNDMNKAT